MRRFLVTVPVIATLGLALVGGGVARTASAAQEASPVGDACPTTTVEENKAIVTRYLEATFNTDDAAAAADVLHEDHDQPHVEGVQGPDEIGTAVAGGFPAVPDMTAEILAIIGENDWVAATVLLKGTHQGDLMGAEGTGAEVDWLGMGMFRVECGEIIESWVVADNHDLYVTVGLEIEPPDEE